MSSHAIIGESKAISRISALIERAARDPRMAVSLHGESGTGKELIAKTIHFSSDRKDKPFITIDIGAIPREMLEAELFGYEQGAFPGAFARSTGLFAEAQGGTVFFDEITDLEPDLQIKVLTLIRKQEIIRIGGTIPVKTDIRIIAATCKVLNDEVKKGRFREDLCQELDRFQIFLPPLVDRGYDIIFLAIHFLKEFCSENNLPAKEFSGKARYKLLSYHYPGNIRELKAIIELAAVMSNAETIEETDILFTPASAGFDLFSREMTLREYEARIIRHFLEKYNNNVVLVARKLAIGKSKIYNMLKGGEI